MRDFVMVMAPFILWLVVGQFFWIGYLLGADEKTTWTKVYIAMAICTGPLGVALAAVMWALEYLNKGILFLKSKYKKS